MKKQYSLIAMDWDYDYVDIAKSIRHYNSKGVYVPCADTEILKRCGALTGANEKQALDFAQASKDKFPFVKFVVYEGNTWGTLKPIKEF